MPKKSLLNNFSSNDLQLNPYDVNPDISDDIQQAITFLMGWHATAQTFRRILADADGRLLVSTSPTQASDLTLSQATVGITAVAALQANPLRKQHIIQNLGTAPIYYGKDATVTTATGLQIPPNGVYIDDVYVGSVYLISGVASQNVRMVEM